MDPSLSVAPPSESRSATNPARTALSAPRFVRSFGFALDGLGYIGCTQPNWLLHLLAGGLVIIGGIVLRVTPLEVAILALTIGVVLAAEAVNTAIEAAVDAIGPEFSVHAKHAKDAAAAAVLVCAATSLVVAVAILLPRLIALA
jgi:diacylglycerol kinase